MTDGRQFTGELENGLLDGWGKMTFPDGRKYVGHFKDGMFIR